MIETIILFWALLCSNPSHTLHKHGDRPMINAATESADDTTGETGNFPPKPPTPPPPPPPAG